MAEPAPEWIVEDDPDGPEVNVVKLTCPRCMNCFWVAKGTWPGRSAIWGVTERTGRTMENYIGRSCPFCFSTPHTPEYVVVRTLDTADLVIPRYVAQGLQVCGLIYYKLEAPAGSIYSPVPGVSMDKIRRSIVWDTDGD